MAIIDFGGVKEEVITRDEFPMSKALQVLKGETIAATLLAHGVRAFRKTEKFREPRGIFCGIGQCTDCIMTVDGKANVRTCVTRVKPGMVVETQVGHGGGRP